MGINALTLQWLTMLHTNGAFLNKRSICEFGPQDVKFSMNSIVKLAIQLEKAKDPEELRRFAASLVNDPRNPRITRAIYDVFGLSEYDSVDLGDNRRSIVADLNYAFSIGKTFSVITNFGTSEHIFSIGNSFITAHNFAEVDGLILFALPAAGNINHGYYHVNPLLYFQVAQANRWKIESFFYVDNVDQRNRIFDGDNSKITFDFSDLPFTLEAFENTPHYLMARKLFENYSENARKYPKVYVDHDDVGVVDYCFCAVRKTVNAPFTYPNQWGQI